MVLVDLHCLPSCVGLRTMVEVSRLGPQPAVTTTVMLSLFQILRLSRSWLFAQYTSLPAWLGARVWSIFGAAALGVERSHKGAYLKTLPLWHGVARTSQFAFLFLLAAVFQVNVNCNATRLISTMKKKRSWSSTTQSLAPPMWMITGSGSEVDPWILHALPAFIV